MAGELPQDDGDRSGGRSPSTGSLSDDPIRSPADDRFDRVGLAHQIGEVVRLLPDHADTAVIGVIGPWGSGKSSVLELVHQDLAHDQGWSVVHFNPWMVDDAAGLVREFFTTLKAGLPKSTREKLSGHLTGLVRRASPVLGLTNLVIPGAGAATEAVKALVTPGEEPLADVLTQMARELEGSRPVLVVIDDLDRLHPDELLTVLKLVRLLGRLPSLYYLLAFDEQTALDLLEATELVPDRNRARGVAYLEKIVQIRFDLPAASDLQLDRFLGCLVRDTFTDSGLSRHDLVTADGRLDDALERLVRPRCGEPRRIRRLCAQLRTSFPLVAGRVDPVDFLVLTLVRAQYPETYRRLWPVRQRLALLPGGTRDSDPDFGSITGNDDANPLLEFLFPPQDGCPDEEPRLDAPPVERLRARLGNASAERRIASLDYVDRYFMLGISEDDVAEDDLATTVRELGSQVLSAAPDPMRHDHEIQRLVTLAARRPGPVCRGLWRLGVELDANDDEPLRVGLIRVLAHLYRTLGEQWGWPPKPVAEYAADWVRFSEAAPDLLPADTWSRWFLLDVLAALHPVRPDTFVDDVVESVTGRSRDPTANPLFRTEGWVPEIVAAAWADVDAVVDTRRAVWEANELPRDRHEAVERAHDLLWVLGPLSRVDPATVAERVPALIREDGPLDVVRVLAANLDLRHDLDAAIPISLPVRSGRWRLHPVVELEQYRDPWLPRDDEHDDGDEGDLSLLRRTHVAHRLLRA